VGAFPSPAPAGRLARSRLHRQAKVRLFSAERDAALVDNDDRHLPILMNLLRELRRLEGLQCSLGTRKSIREEGAEAMLPP
jgi:hypothetical protein